MSESIVLRRKARMQGGTKKTGPARCLSSETNWKMWKRRNWFERNEQHWRDKQRIKSRMKEKKQKKRGKKRDFVFWRIAKHAVSSQRETNQVQISLECWRTSRTRWNPPLRALIFILILRALAFFSRVTLSTKLLALPRDSSSFFAYNF